MLSLIQLVAAQVFILGGI